MSLRFTLRDEAETAEAASSRPNMMANETLSESLDIRSHRDQFAPYLACESSGANRGRRLRNSPSGGAFAVRRKRSGKENF